MGWPCHEHKAGSHDTTPPHLKTSHARPRAGCHQPPCGTYAGVGQLVDRSEDISVVPHWYDGSRLASRDITDNLLPLHLHVTRLQ